MNAFHADESPRAEKVLRDLSHLTGSRCRACGVGLCPHEALMSMVMGMRDAPRCLPCLAAGLGREVISMEEHLLRYIGRQECYRQAWAWAGSRESGERTECRWTARAIAPPVAGGAEPPPGRIGGERRSDSMKHDAEWDAGMLGCGDLVLELRMRMQPLGPGSVFQLTAKDPGASSDIPAWCGMTGNALVRAEPPIYWIQRKEG